MLVFVNLLFVLVYGYLLVNEIEDGEALPAAMYSAVVTVNLLAVGFNLLKA